MNERARRMIRGDGRNPYGSRGGYVISYEPRHRRDRGMDDEYPMDYRYERDTRHNRREYEQEPYAKMRGNFEYDKYDYGDDYDYDDDMRDYRGGRRSRHMDDYGDDYMYDMRGRRRNSRGQYMSDRRGRDYGDDMDDRLTQQEIKNWEKDLINDDGSHGAHFQPEQIDQVAQSLGINPKEFGDGVLCTITNAMYADYCGVARKFGVDRIEYYIELGKAFLQDRDFSGSGAEKAYLYYKFIVEQDE